MRLYIVRHGDPDYENNTITPAGHLEAQALAKRFDREGLDKIYSSPMGRAMQTMKYTAEMLNIEPVIEEWTRELSDVEIEVKPHGEVSIWNVHGEIVRNELPKMNRDSWHTSDFLKPNPKVHEICNVVAEASDNFLKQLGYVRENGKYRCIKPNTDKIAVFCHAGFAMTWLAHLLEIPAPLIWSGFWLAPSSVTTVLFDERTEGWAVPRCLGVGDVSHLYEANLPVRPRGIMANYY